MGERCPTLYPDQRDAAYEAAGSTTIGAGGAQVEGHAFPDHHRFVAADFNGLRRPILMTEKDAVKCRHLEVPGLWAVPARAALPPAFFERLKYLLRERAR